MLDGWQDYCDRNWLNDDGEDLFAPELRVKRFLDSVGYYLLYGQMDGIVTTYKDVVNQAREIPVSSCPESVNNQLYASGGASDDREEQQSFRTMTEILDAKLPKKKTVPRPNTVSRRRKLQRIREDNGGAEIERYRVGTDNFFWCGNDHLMIYNYDKYNAKVVNRRNGETDILYDMDTILRCGERWYDQNGDPIPDECIHPVGGIICW